MNAKVSNLIFKTIGGVGLAMSLYDSHYAGKMQSKMSAGEHKAETLAHHLQSDMKLDSPSVIKAALKRNIFGFHLDENLTEFFVSIGGYAKGFSTMMVSHVIPLGLAAGTVLSPKGSLLSKTFGIGLLGYGGIFLLQEGLGIGKPH